MAIGPRPSARRTSPRPLVESLEGRLLMTTLPEGYTEAVVAEGLRGPTSMEVAPDGRLWVLEQGGTVRVFHDGSATGSTALAIPATAIDGTAERGLLGIAFGPGYDVASPAPDYVFLYYTSTAAPATHNRISRFAVDNTDPDRPTLSGEVVLVDLDPLSDIPYHNGGAIHFGPDGKLYVGVGDNTDAFGSQRLDTRLGKMLRYNPDGTIPADNPTSFPGIAGVTIGANRAIWAVGLRNPFTFAFQPGTGRMFINDVGQLSFEEVNEGRAGANYGWPLTEGDFDQAAFPDLTRPYYAYAHGSGPADGYSITGGVFYNPASPTSARFPSSFDGDYFFTDAVNQWIDVMDAGTRAVTRFASDTTGAVDLHVAADGSLLYLAFSAGRVVRISRAESPAPEITEPPQGQVVPYGRRATFTVAATGPAPLRYQWQRAEAGADDFAPIPGATSPSLTLDDVRASDDGDRFRVFVSNDFGGRTSEAATLSATADRAPLLTLSVDAGLVSDRFIAGRPIGFSGAATDPEDGVLGPERLSYRVDYLTSIGSGNPLVRPFVPEAVGRGSGTFTPATSGPYTLTDVVYRITMTATDSQGLTTTVTRDIAPNVATITVTTSPAGLRITTDGQPSPTPHAFDSVVGFEWPIGAEASQAIGSSTYVFEGWSDGGAAVHTIVAPAGGATYVAAYKLKGVATPSDPAGPSAPVGPIAPAGPNPPGGPARPRVPSDYDGDGRTDLAAYITAAGTLVYRPSSGGADVVAAIGLPGRGRTVPAPGDYDGDGRADAAAYLVRQGVLTYRPSGGGPDVSIRIGVAGAGGSVPAPGDYDGDGRDDAAVYLPGRRELRVRPSSGGPDRVIPLGLRGRGRTLPAVGDYDGDGRDDVAAFLPTQGGFLVRTPAGAGERFIPLGRLGLGQSIPLPGDYDGDGVTDLAVSIPALGQVHYRPSGGGADVVVKLGKAKGGAIPVPGHYSGSGKAELATFTPKRGTFSYRPAGAGEVVVVTLGGEAAARGGILPATR